MKRSGPKPRVFPRGLWAWAVACYQDPLAPLEPVCAKLALTRGGLQRRMGRAGVRRCRSPVAPETWRRAEREYRDPSIRAETIAARVGVTVSCVYVHMAEAGIHRTRGNSVLRLATLRAQGRKPGPTRTTPLLAPDRAERHKIRCLTRMGERRRLRCHCGALSTGSTCPNGHRINDLNLPGARPAA
jgi:hypothetical protein